MSKVIIGIHGLGNKPPKNILEKWWKLAIEEGFKKIGKPISPYKFEMVYWADLMYEKPKDPEITDKEDPFYLHEKYVPGPDNFISEEHPTRKKILDFVSRQLDNLFLNEDYSLNYTSITDTILRRYFKDLDVYYKEKCTDENLTDCEIKKIIRKRTVDIISKYKKDEILVIGHSMGSIIAYDVLSFSIPTIPIVSLITIGSPLGIPIVKSKIAAELEHNHFDKTRLSTPDSVVHSWYNFSDIEDKVAIDYQLADDFLANKNLVKAVDFEVHNDYTINGERNPHKSYGYLRTPEFAQKLDEFLSYRKPTLWRNIQKNIAKLFKQQLLRKDHNLQNL